MEQNMDCGVRADVTVYVPISLPTHPVWQEFLFSLAGPDGYLHARILAGSGYARRWENYLSVELFSWMSPSHVLKCLQAPSCVMGRREPARHTP